MSKQCSETKEKCGACNKSTGSESWIACELCDGWFHLKCLNINKESYKLLQALETCHWYCGYCNEKIGKIIRNMVRLYDRITEVDNRVAKVETELKASNGTIVKMRQERQTKLCEIQTELLDVRKDLEAKQTELETKVKLIDTLNDKVNSQHLEFKNLNHVVEQIDDAFKNLVKERLENVVEKHTMSFTDIVKQQLEEEMVKNVGETVRKEVHESLGKVSNNIQEVQTSIQETQIQAAEQRDRESRRNNIILYRVPEGDAPSNEERNKQDIAFCLQLFNMGMQVGIGEEDLVHVFRLGKRPESGAPRPLMVQLTRYNLKNLIMESLFKLNSLN